MSWFVVAGGSWFRIAGDPFLDSLAGLRYLGDVADIAVLADVGVDRLRRTASGTGTVEVPLLPTIDVGVGVDGTQ